MFMIVRSSDKSTKKFVDKDISHLITKDAFNSLSVDTIEVTDYFEKGKASYNRIYQIYDGKMEILINEKQIILLKGDGIFIQEGMDYEIEGTFKAIAMNRVAI